MALMMVNVNASLVDNSIGPCISLSGIAALALPPGEDPATCTVSVGCPPYGPHDFVSCSGNECQRYLDAVECDGQKTTCL